VSQAYVNADQVWRWCIAMGWDIPEGCGVARIEHKHREAREKSRIAAYQGKKNSVRFRIIGPGGHQLRTPSGRTKTWKTEADAQEWLENAPIHELIPKEDNL